MNLGRFHLLDSKIYPKLPVVTIYYFCFPLFTLFFFNFVQMFGVLFFFI